MKKSPISILVVDDHQLFHDAIVSYLSGFLRVSKPQVFYSFEDNDFSYTRILFPIVVFFYEYS